MHESLVFLVEELKNDDIAIRVNSVYRIKVVVALQSNDENEKHILNLIEKIIEREDDEVLFALAKELSVLSNILPKFKKRIIDYLATLCQVEETVIREQSVESLEVIIKKLND